MNILSHDMNNIYKIIVEKKKTCVFSGFVELYNNELEIKNIINHSTRRRLTIRKKELCCFFFLFSSISLILSLALFNVYCFITWIMFVDNSRESNKCGE